jgi:hypothetical protein
LVFGLNFTQVSGRITAQGRVQIQIPIFTGPAILIQIAGRTAAQSQVKIQPLVFVTPPTVLQLVAGRITASGSARLRTPGMRLFLAGRTSAAGTAQLAITPAALVLHIAGTIRAAARASFAAPRLSPQPVRLSGGILATSTAQLATGNYGTRLAGSISGSTMLSGLAGPQQPFLIGRIGAATRLWFGIAEIIEPLPPYPPPFPTYDTNYYLDHITSEHNQRPRYMATVGMSVDPMIQDQQLVAGFSGLFDLDYCIGQQEDFTGQWVGKSRWIEIPAGFFSWDEEGLGWNQANWKGPADADNSIERLDDYHYRLLLYATVIANHWNGSVPTAYSAWDTLFQYTGIKVIIQDYGNMTMLYGLLSSGPIDNVLLSLFTTGQMDLRPEGIELRAYALQPTPGVPFFAWDAASDAVHGWDTGYWGLMLTPGQSYIPGVGTLWDAPTTTGTAARTATSTAWDDGNTKWDYKG